MSGKGKPGTGGDLAGQATNRGGGCLSSTDSISQSPLSSQPPNLLGLLAQARDLFFRSFDAGDLAGSERHARVYRSLYPLAVKRGLLPADPPARAAPTPKRRPGPKLPDPAAYKRRRLLAQQEREIADLERRNAEIGRRIEALELGPWP